MFAIYRHTKFHIHALLVILTKPKTNKILRVAAIFLFDLPKNYYLKRLILFFPRSMKAHHFGILTYVALVLLPPHKFARPLLYYYYYYHHRLLYAGYPYTYSPDKPCP